MKICNIDGCEDKQKARGWCRLHYERWQRNGDPIGTQIRKICQYKNCNGKHTAQGFCPKHYTRFKLYGDPSFIKRNTRPKFLTIEETFLDGFARLNDMECWNWHGPKIKSGYGRVNFGNKSYGAHRFSYQYYISSIPEGMFVCHKCDNPCCVNPAHLFIGTIQDNNADCVNKGRHITFPNAKRPKGSKHALSKLTEKEVMQIKRYIAEGMKDSDIFSLFNVSLSAINHIRIKRTWKHLENINE